ncbi:MAG: lysophospholipid acyltransferase family protein [Bacteroidales bacterium]|nr:lysophospholipid acyltransferase family protein [Bacteroidales bacterium]
MQDALGVKGLSGKVLTRLLFGVLGMRKANRIHASKARPDGPAFSEEVLEDLGVSYEIPEEQLAHIPAEGGFISVSNHHFGAIDGMILNSVIGSRRSDYKILTTYFLSMVAHLKDWFIPVDNFATGGAKSVSGIRTALEHIDGGGALGLFPAGEVATWQKKKDRTAVSGKRVVEDKPWAENMMKLVRNSGLPVIPIYFDGTNSRTFHVMGRIHPILRTLRLVREMTGAKGKNVKVRIGQAIPAAQLAELDDKVLGQYLRNRCYALEAQCLADFTEKPEHGVQQELIEPVDTGLIRSQMAALDHRILFETGDYRAYLLDAADAPDAMRELYRLRERTFRAVGEGTGKPMDTDPYDNFYRHLVLWNVPNGEITGAYRIGYGPGIVASHGGVPGFYTSTLLNFGANAEPILAHSVELGRSFVREEYQRDVLPLKLLLAGLCVAISKDPEVNCCAGLVTISASIPDFYKSLLVHFLERDFHLEDASGFAMSTLPFKPGFLRVNPDQLLQVVPKGDIDAFDRLLGSLSDGKYRIPVLFRKYFSCGAQASCVNVDPDFSDCVDVMILLRLADFPPASIKSFVRSLPEEIQNSVLRHFYGTENV